MPSPSSRRHGSCCRGASTRWGRCRELGERSPIGVGTAGPTARVPAIAPVHVLVFRRPRARVQRLTPVEFPLWKSHRWASQGRGYTLDLPQSGATTTRGSDGGRPVSYTHL